MTYELNEIPARISYLTARDALLDGLRLGGAGVWRWEIDSDRLEWTHNLESVHGLPSGTFDGTLSSFQQDLHPDDAEGVWAKILASIETGEAYRAVYRTAPRPDKPEKWIETVGGIVTAKDGPRYLSGICFDVTERIQGEQELERRLIQQRAVARFGSFALNEDRLQSILDEAVRVAAEVLEVPLTKILEFSESAECLVVRAGIGWADGIVGRGEVGIDLASQAGFTLSVKEPVIVADLRSETRFNGPPLLHDHQVRSGISVVIPGFAARPFGVFGIHDQKLRQFDRTDAEFLQSLANIVAGAARQFATAEHRMLLVREMAHRAGNLLQLVSSIAAQTFNSQPDLHLAKRSFSDRLSALARSNYVVSRNGWRTTRFSELAEESFRPFGSQITTEGRDILLPAELSFDMGLVLHELATNGVKYGSLGRDDGVIRVSWSLLPHDGNTRMFTYVWDDPQSHGDVAAREEGFGSKLLQALIETKWNGKVSIRTDPNFRITLEVPVAD